MFTRRMVFGLLAMLALGSAVMAKPPGLPINPLPEGRELDPVSRDHYLTTPDAEFPATVLLGATEIAVVRWMCDAILFWCTIPLGTVPSNSAQ